MPFILLRLLWRSLREPNYRATLGQRFGFVVGFSRQTIWVHSVSAGETIAAIPLIERFLAKGHRVLVTTMTPTGRERVQSLLGEKVEHCYAPYDLPGAVRRFLAEIKPSALVIIDTELWPNTIHQVHRQNIPIYLVNARLSIKSAAGYRKIAWLARPMIKKISCVFAQSDIQGKRFLGLGLDASRLMVSGSIKFDAVLPKDFDDRRASLQATFKHRFCFLAASTHEGEEQLVLDAFEPHLKDKTNLLILAPRHPHRAEKIATLCASMSMPVLRHSEQKACGPETKVYLLDTMGELIYFYGAAQLALVGGSMVDVGGHNPMEPASLGVPMLMGVFTRNIDDIAEQFIEAGAMLRVADAKGLDLALASLVKDAPLRASMSAAALRVMAINAGALDQIEAFILKELK